MSESKNLAEIEVKLQELKTAVYFLSEQVEHSRKVQKENFEQFKKQIEVIDATNISKITKDYNSKTDLMVGAVGSLIGKLESTEKHIHALQTQQLHEMNSLLLKVLHQIRDNQHLTADAISNLSKHIASQDKILKNVAKHKLKDSKTIRNKKQKG